MRTITENDAIFMPYMQSVFHFKRVDADHSRSTNIIWTCKRMLHELKSAYTELFETNKDLLGWNANNLSCMFKNTLHVSIFYEKK